MKVKQILSLILCLLSILPMIVGCSTTGSKETTGAAPVEHVLSVGFGKVDVTPTEPVPLGGFPQARMSENIRDRLYATCIAFTDEKDNTVIMFALEALYCYDVMKFAAGDVAKATGVPFANIMIGTNHSHSAPNFPSESNPAIQKYSDMLKKKMVEAAQNAMADRKPAKMHITTTYPENINFIRHYKLDNGNYCGDNFGNNYPAGTKIVGHVREVDNALQLVKFTREGAKDIIMMNWQGHPTGHGKSEYHYSIMSYSGVAVSAVEEQLDVHCMYVLGASGNVNNQTRIASEKLYKTYEERAKALAGYVVAAKDYQEVEVGAVQMLRSDIPCTPKEGGSNKVDVTLNAFSIGDVALVTAPYEMFCENGEGVKNASPFKMTFVSSCSNGRGSYIPSISTYEYNNKPDVVYGITKTAYAPGTGELLENAFVDMLNQLHETK